MLKKTLAVHAILPNFTELRQRELVNYASRLANDLVATTSEEFIEALNTRLRTLGDFDYALFNLEGKRCRLENEDAVVKITHKVFQVH